MAEPGLAQHKAKKTATREAHTHRGFCEWASSEPTSNVEKIVVDATAESCQIT